MTLSLSTRSTPSSPKKQTIRKPSKHTSYLSKTIQSITKQNSNTKNESVSYLKMTEDIATMLTIKDQIEKVFSMTFKVIKDNDTTPEVLKILEPVVNAVKRSYPIFHKSGTQYFITFATMQESAKTNQVLSSASVRLPRESFVKDWNHFCLTIDNLTNAHPPPHSKEISAKFESIRSSLNYIKMTNENRKNPAIHLSKYINSVQSLCDNLYNQIMNLFSTPTFPHFETDLLSTYITNVKSFLGIINNAFSNEFLQSGVMFFDLARVKSNIFTDCNEIVQSLKSAFAFPIQMGCIQKLKDELNVNVNNIIEKLSVPFAVVKPSEKSVLRHELQNERTKELRKIEEEIEENADDSSPQVLFDQYSEAVKKMRNFLTSLCEIINSNPSSTDDIWFDLDEALKSVKKFKTFSDDQKKKIYSLNKEIKKLNETDQEREMLYTNRKEMFISHADEQNNRYLKLEHEFKVLTKKCCELLTIIQEKDKEIDDLKSLGDPLFLKKSLVEIGGAFFNNQNLTQLKTNNDRDLVNKVKELQTIYFQKKCESCIEYEKIFDEMVDKMSQFIEKNEVKQPLLIFNDFYDSYKSIKDQNDQFSLNFDEIKKKLQKMNETMTKVNPKETKEREDDTQNDDDVHSLFSSTEAQLKKLIELKESIEKSSNKKEENYLKTIRQISTKLSKILNDNRESSLLPIENNTDKFNEVRTQLVDVISAQLRNLRDKKIESDQKVIELANHINKLKQQRKDVTQRLSALIKFTIPESKNKTNNEETNFFKAVEVTELRHKNNQSTIKDLEDRINKMKNEMEAINTRLLGVSGQQNEMEINHSNENSIIDSIYKNIEIIQDQKEKLMKNSNTIEDKDLVFKNCLLSLLIMNDPKIDGNSYFNDDKKLIESATKIVEEFINLKKEINSDFLSVSQIDQIFKPVVSYLRDSPQKENRQLFLTFISKTFLSYLQTFSLLDKYSADVDLAFRSFDNMLDNDQNVESLCSFNELIHGLKNSLDKIAAQVCSGSLLTIMYKFISLLTKCIDYIQLHDNYSFFNSTL